MWRGDRETGNAPDIGHQWPNRSQHEIEQTQLRVVVSFVSVGVLSCCRTSHLEHRSTAVLCDGGDVGDMEGSMENDKNGASQGNTKHMTA